MQWSGRRTRGAFAAVAVVVAALIVVSVVRMCRAPRGAPVVEEPAIAGLPAAPPLGWNSWNAYGCDIDEDKIHRAADDLVASGMRDAGYRYVVVDDCWSDPARDLLGRLRANAGRFPSGMRALAGYMHVRGLKFGIYAAPGDQTCAQLYGDYQGATGSRGYEQQDAKTFAEWGVDFLKYDWCGPPASADKTVRAFVRMRDALRATGAPILYSINPNSGSALRQEDLGRFAGVATMTRISQNVIPVWHGLGGEADQLGVRDAVDNAAAGKSTCVTKPGYFCDYDMLAIGAEPIIAEGAATPALTDEEERTQFAMWAMWAAPLMVGNAPGATAPRTRALMANRAALAIDQDPLVRPATAVRDGDGSLWTRPLADGSTAIAMVNREDSPRLFSTTMTNLGLAASRWYEVADVFAGATGKQNAQLRIQVAPHDTVLLRARAVS